MSILILLGVSLIIYFLIRLMPVDFIQDKINAINQGGATVSEETVNAMYEMYGLGDTASSAFSRVISHGSVLLPDLISAQASYTVFP